MPRRQANAVDLTGSDEEWQPSPRPKRPKKEKTPARPARRAAAAACDVDDDEDEVHITGWSGGAPSTAQRVAAGRRQQEQQGAGTNLLSHFDAAAAAAAAGVGVPPGLDFLALLAAPPPASAPAAAAPAAGRGGRGPRAASARAARVVAAAAKAERDVDEHDLHYGGEEYQEEAYGAYEEEDEDEDDEEEEWGPGPAAGPAAANTSVLARLQAAQGNHSMATLYSRYAKRTHVTASTLMKVRPRASPASSCSGAVLPAQWFRACARPRARPRARQHPKRAAAVPPPRRSPARPPARLAFAQELLAFDVAYKDLSISTWMIGPNPYEGALPAGLLPGLAARAAAEVPRHAGGVAHPPAASTRLLAGGHGPARRTIIPAPAPPPPCHRPRTPAPPPGQVVSQCVGLGCSKGLGPDTQERAGKRVGKQLVFLAPFVWHISTYDHETQSCSPQVRLAFAVACCPK
jgi:hypothetical protein